MKVWAQEESPRAVVAPVTNRSAVPGSDPWRVWDRRVWLMAIPLALVVIHAFSPALLNGFVLWDDNENFLENPHFRGLGAANVKWAWTTFWVGAYQPLTWMLFETQYVFCQLDPRGYHLTSLVLQVVNAVVLYILTLAVLVRCRIDCHLASPWICSVSAGLATALFAVHPLRVETVAWATCQPYLPCILFSMLSVLAYLRAFTNDSSTRWGWLACSFVLFVTALLFHASAVSLPLVLLILDVYPLRRIPDETGSWFGGMATKALLQKVPFIVVSLRFAALAIAAKAGASDAIQHDDISEGIARAGFAVWFYIQKTVIPTDLIAVYPLPLKLNWLAYPYSLTLLATLSVSVGLFLSRRRWPGLLAAWLSYLVILAPNSGLVRINDQIAADRYSYMSMLGLVFVAAAALCGLWRKSSRAGIAIVVIGLGVLWGLTALTRRQCRTWLDSETLWTHALTHRGASSFLPHNNFGMVLFSQGNYRGAEAEFTEALRLSPDCVDAHNNLGTIFAHQKRYAEAEAHLGEAIRLNSGFMKAHFNLGRVCAGQGKYKEAAAHYAFAIRLRPGSVGAHQNLGNVLTRLGNYEAAKAQYAEVMRLEPGSAEPYNSIAIIMATCPDPKYRDGMGAIQSASRACELTKWKDPRFLDTLAAAQAEAGDFDAAATSQNRAIELATDEQRKDDYRSRLVLYQAKKPYRQGAP